MEASTGGGEYLSYSIQVTCGMVIIKEPISFQDMWVKTIYGLLKGACELFYMWYKECTRFAHGGVLLESLALETCHTTY